MKRKKREGNAIQSKRKSSRNPSLIGRTYLCISSSITHTGIVLGYMTAKEGE